MSLKIHITSEGPDVTIAFEGVLDESSQLPELSEPVKGVLRLDLEKLTLINSMGIHKWITWMRHRTNMQASMVLFNCRPVVINQINILRGFLPEFARVDSFFVPYSCENCGFDEKLLMTRDVDFDDQRHVKYAMEKTCPSCGGVLALDIMHQRYFNFIHKRSA
jgi:predicted RNA-binding Zn-ribbon protein involved in translation (DUF1610 family)